MTEDIRSELSSIEVTSACCQGGWRRDHKSSDRRYDSIQCQTGSHSDHKSSKSILKCMVVHTVNGWRSDHKSSDRIYIQNIDKHGSTSLAAIASHVKGDIVSILTCMSVHAVNGVLYNAYRQHGSTCC